MDGVQPQGTSYIFANPERRDSDIQKVKEVWNKIGLNKNIFINTATLIGRVIVVIIDYTPLIGKIAELIRGPVAAYPTGGDADGASAGGSAASIHRALAPQPPPPPVPRRQIGSDQLQEVPGLAAIAQHNTQMSIVIDCIASMSEDDRRALRGRCGRAQGQFSPRLMTEEMAQHLLSNRLMTSLGNKLSQQAKITLMQGMLGSTMAVVAKAFTTKDFNYCGVFNRFFSEHGGDRGREVLISSTIQPDFESSFTEVAMGVFGLEGYAIKGQHKEDLAEGRPHFAADVTPEYEMSLVRHMVYHFMSDHRLPCMSEVGAIQPRAFLDGLTKASNFQAIRDQFVQVQVGGHSGALSQKVLSMEAIYGFYKHQLRNEIEAIENYGKDYCYTFDPAEIFLGGLTGPDGQKQKMQTIFARLHALALKGVLDERQSARKSIGMKSLAYNDYNHQGLVAFYHAVLNDHNIQCLDKSRIMRQQNRPWQFHEDGVFDIRGQILVLHNNSDGFGDNITYEADSSLDGFIGHYTTASDLLGNTAAKEGRIQFRPTV